VSGVLQCPESCAAWNRRFEFVYQFGGNPNDVEAVDDPLPSGIPEVRVEIAVPQQAVDGFR
jgi:hypothetical protein